MTENIEVFVQNSIRILSDAGAVYIDPIKINGEPEDAAFVLITHDHYDHFSPEDIAKVAGENTILIVPEKMEDKAAEVAGYVNKIVTVKPGISDVIDGLKLETVPAYNILKPFHRKDAGWVGYIITTGGERIYIAGDTDVTKEAKAVKCDVALVPVGGTFTMDAKKAAELINEIKPTVAIPVHYGAFVGSPKDGEIFAANVKEPVQVELKMKF